KKRISERRRFFFLIVCKGYGRFTFVLRANFNFICFIFLYVVFFIFYLYVDLLRSFICKCERSLVFAVFRFFCFVFFTFLFCFLVFYFICYFFYFLLFIFYLLLCF